MPVEIVNNYSSVKYGDDVTEMEIILLDEDNVKYPIAGKLVKVWFYNEVGFLTEKLITNFRNGNVLLVLTKDDYERLGTGELFVEIAVEESAGRKIFPSEGHISLNIEENAKAIKDEKVTTVSLQYFEDKLTAKFNEKAAEVEEIAVKAIIPDEGITKKLLAPGSVDETKTTLFTRYGENLFNKELAIQGKFIAGPTGILNDSDNYYAFFTKPGDFKPGDYISKPDYLPHYAWYDVNGKYISGGSNNVSGQNLIQAPANSVVLGTSIPISNLNSYMLNVGKTLLPYQEYGYKFANENTVLNTLKDKNQALDANILENETIDDDKIKPNSLSLESVAFSEPELNLYDDSKSLDASLNENDGTILTSSTQRVSNYMLVSANDVIRFSHNIAKYAYYDSDGKCLKAEKLSVVGKTLNVPDIQGIYSLRVDFYRPNASVFMSVKNQDIPNNYFPYSLKIKKSSLPSTTEDFLLFLPSEIYIAAGRTIELYNKQVSWTGNPNNYHFQWICDVGSSLKRKWSCKATEAMLGNHALTCNVYDNNMKLVASATTTIKIVTNVVSRDLKILPIGDSLTNNKGWLQEVINLSNGKITFVGTRWNGDVQGGQRNHEGRSGATAGFYLGNNVYSFDSNGATDRNPFYNPATGKFDYQYYKDTYGINPDGIQLFLGTNGIKFDPTENANNIKKIVDGIREVDTTIPIFIVFTLYRGDQNGIGKQLSSDGYSAGSGVWKLEEDRKVFNLMVQNYKLLNGYSNLKFIPISLTHDSEYNFRDTVQTPVNPRSTITELQDAEATHPSKIPAGYLQMADSEFSTYQGAYS